MVEGWGVFHRRRGRHGRDDGASREAPGLCLVARPEEDEGAQGPAVRERRGALGRWAGEWEVGGVAWASQQAKARGVSRPAGLEKKRKRKSIQN
jgi:hypothetical protein